MTTNILLDTNIIKRLVSRQEFSQYLTQLKFLVDNHHIRLLVPDVLLTEWEKHREEEKKNLEAELRNEKMEARLSGLFKDTSAAFKLEKIDDAFELLYSQLETIDDLLNHKSIRINITQELTYLVISHRMANKMPFSSYKKKDNLIDALLIFAALDHLKIYNETELFFVTENNSEFAEGKTGNYRLHSDISEKFPTITTHYCTHIEEAFKALDSRNIPRFKREKQKTNYIKNNITVDTTRPVLHQLYEYLFKRFSNLSYIPKKLFAEHYPIIIADSFQYCHRPFTLITDNQSVFDLLTRIKAENDVILVEDPSLITCDDGRDKARFIFKILFQNRITKVAFKEMEPVDLKYTHPEKDCNCSLCQYKRMDWQDILNEKTNPDRLEKSTSITEKMMIAYGHYKISHFAKAAKLLLNLYKENQHEQNINLYIIGFNLKHLAPILRHHYWDDTEITALAEELSEINLDNLCKDCTTPENRYIIRWIHEKTFISEGLSVLYEKVNAITDIFYRQSSGYNEYTLELAEGYGQVDGFLNRNYIIYDYYSDFQNLTELFIQGLLASHGWNSQMGGRLSSIDDYWLFKLLFWGKADTIQKYLLRYKLKEVKYLPSNVQGKRFVDLFHAFANTYPAIVKASHSHQKGLSRFFWDTYSDILYNAITLLGIISLDKEAFNKAAMQLNHLLQKENHLMYFRLLKHLRFLLLRKGKDFTEETLISFYKSAIFNKEFHADRYFEILIGILQDRFITIELTDEEFDKVNKNYLDELLNPDSDNSWITTAYIFSTLQSEIQKRRISSRVRECLSESFKADNYYKAIMFDIIHSDINYNNLYGAVIEVIVKQGPQKRFFNSKEYYTDTRIDNYLNFCWKLSIPIKPGIIEYVSGLGNYYRWLFNMEIFDYSLFNPDWLYNHFTVYFKRRFRRCMPLKQHLLKVIKDDPNTEVERLFILIYCFDD